MKSDGSPLLSVKDLAVAAILALAATAFASGRLSPAARQELRQNGSVSYPATYAVPLDAKAVDTSRLSSILMGSEFVKSLERVSDSMDQSRTIRPFLQGQKNWSRVPLPADLSRTLGGAAMYALRGDGLVRELVCVRGGTMYSLPDDLNQLLKDCGMKFTNGGIHRWTPLVIWVCSACDRIEADASGMPISDEFQCTFDSVTGGQAPLVSSLTVGHLVADTARSADVGHSVYGVLPGFVSRVTAGVRDGDTSYAVEIYTANGGSHPGELYPVEFHLPQTVLRIYLSMPELGMLDEDHPEFGVAERGQRAHSGLAER
jgi:hypothetical protein